MEGRSLNNQGTPSAPPAWRTDCSFTSHILNTTSKEGHAFASQEDPLRITSTRAYF